MMGSGFGSAGRVVASKTRGPQFESSHRPKILLNIVYCQVYWKDKNNEKEAGNGPFLKKWWWSDIEVEVKLKYCNPKSRNTQQQQPFAALGEQILGNFIKALRK